MSLPLHDLSEGLEALKNDLKPFLEVADDDAVEIEGSEAKKLWQVVDAMHRLARKMETELGVFRTVEAGRSIREALEQLSAEQLSGLMPGDGSNVIRPNFGGKGNE